MRLCFIQHKGYYELGRKPLNCIYFLLSYFHHAFSAVFGLLQQVQESFSIPCEWNTVNISVDIVNIFTIFSGFSEYRISDVW